MTETMQKLFAILAEAKKPLSVRELQDAYESAQGALLSRSRINNLLTNLQYMECVEKTRPPKRSSFTDPIVLYRAVGGSKCEKLAAKRGQPAPAKSTRKPK